MTPQLYHEVVLLQDFPEQNLKRGDVAMYVEPVRSAEGVDGAVLEVVQRAWRIHSYCGCTLVSD